MYLLLINDVIIYSDLYAQYKTRVKFDANLDGKKEKKIVYCFSWKMLVIHFLKSHIFKYVQIANEYMYIQYYIKCIIIRW